MTSQSKKKTALVLGATSNLMFALGTFLTNLKEVSPHFADEVLILYDESAGVKKSDIVAMNKLFPTKFIEFDLPIDSKEKNSQLFGHFSKMVFSKYETLKFLKKYKTVVWLDYDMILLSDISEILKPAESGAKMLLEPNKSARSFYKPIDEYNMDTWGMCGSIIIFQDHLKDYMKMYKFCYKSLEKYINNLYLGEQGIFDIMLQEFNLMPEILNHDTYTLHPNDFSKNQHAKILHCYGVPKFWNGLENEVWQKNYKAWLKLGGSKNPYIQKTPNLWQKIKLRLGLSI